MANPSIPTHAIDPVLTNESTTALKRHIAPLEEENVQLTNKMSRSPIHSWTREGHAIRRLVSLVDPLTDLIAEYDRRLMVADGNEDLELIESTAEKNRMFWSFKKLMVWCPSLKRTMQFHTELALACHEKGADGACGDDANTLKISVIIWLNEQPLPPYPLLAVDDKQGQGFNHDLTGNLLCPVNFNWLDAPARNAIRDYLPNYAVTAHMWPSFLYTKGQYNPENPSNGLFKGELLVRAFHCIFTSPNSSRKEVNIDGNAAELQGSPDKKQRMRCNVAGLLKMRSVEPRVIAYIAVQLCFALSSCTFWTIKDNNFNYEIFYHNIVDWFELSPLVAKSKETENLLRWWNRRVENLADIDDHLHSVKLCRMVFGRRYVSTLKPQDIATLSIARSRA